MRNDPVKRDVVFIEAGNNAYQEHVSALAKSFQRQCVVPFLGAGISKAEHSCLPLARDLTQPILDAFWKSVDQFLKETQPKAEDINAAKEILDAAPLERLLAALMETHGRDRTIDQFLDCLGTWVWNKNHGALGALGAAGLVTRYITLNFDLLIEEAVRAHGGASITECPLSDSKSFTIGRAKVPVKIVKPHGSLSPPDPANGRFGFNLVSTTIKEVGDRPDARNRRCLEQLLRSGDELLVAGYSDDDWDVFPIVQELASRLSHVHWVHHAWPDAVIQRRAPWEEVGTPKAKRERRIRDWLTKCEVGFTSYVGDPTTLLCDITKELNCEMNPPPIRKVPVKYSTPQLFLDTPPNDETRLRTAVSMSILLQDRGRFNELLLAWLLGQPIIQKNPELEARLRRVLVQTHHTRRELPSAMRQMKRVIQLKANLYGGIDGRAADDLLWFGYEYLCLLKRPSLSFIAAPLLFQKGRKLMLQAARLARNHDRSECRRICEMARYYQIDLCHTWAGHTLFLGHPYHRLIRTSFVRVAKMYARFTERHPELMSLDYYWLRGLESKLHAGYLPESNDAWQKIEDQLDVIQHRYKILQNYVQSGNALVFKALVEFWKTGHVRRDLMEQAEQAWSGRDGEARSGLYRIAQYRRYFGLDSPLDTIRRLRQNAQNKP